MDETKASQAEAKPTPNELRDDATLIAKLLRDAQTGKLLVEIGDNRFAASSELGDPALHTNLTTAAFDFMQWLKPPEKSEREDQPKPSDETPKPASQAKSMIEEINEILERKSDAGEAPLGLRLLEGVDGTLRIFIGVTSYSIEDLPDPQVRRVIKEAVAEWEARQ
ncbi:MAG TPA: hypothetical protein G4O08_00990 [Anaerolineae bacterium]|nr:hypothetical protein [Anaerolineae bacterium]